MKKIFRVIKLMLNKIDEDNISEFAAEISFFIILSLIPFIIIFFSIFKYTNLENEVIFFIIKEIIPKGTQEFFFNLINEHHLKYINIISLSGVVSLWSAAKGMFSLVKGIRNIYGINTNKLVLRMKIESCIYTAILCFSIIIFAFFITFINLDIFFKFSGLVIVILFFIFLLSLYIIIPKRYKTKRNQSIGAFFSAIMLYFVTEFFSCYINVFDNFSNTFGSLATIILVMIWIYSCSYIVLLGAEINITYEEYKKY